MAVFSDCENMVSLAAHDDDGGTDVDECHSSIYSTKCGGGLDAFLAIIPDILAKR